jgi:hypothetical protein
MKSNRILFLGVAFALVAFASVGIAGDYHYGLDLVCSECHVMHYSQTHGYNQDGGGFSTPLADGPHEYLLRDDINDLCLSCHDGSAFAPDVFETHANGYVRQGGALNDVTSSGPYYPADGHTLNSTAVAPGSSPAWNNPDGLNCANCHGVHGANPANISSYRNLGGYGTGNGSYPYGAPVSYERGDVEIANSLTAWVFEDASGGVNAQHYGVGAITFNEPDETASGYAAFCKSCHTEFHGAVGGAEIGGVGAPPEEFVRHPANGVQIGELGGGHSSIGNFASRTSQVQVMSPAGLKAGNYTATDVDLTPSCMSCHKGHGNKNAFGLIFMTGSGTVTEEGDGGSYRDLCKQCHTEG